jgi:endonuclease/exonuclease/phosphatase family metal-dependent hydrolase
MRDRVPGALFSIASYNIHRCVGIDRRRDPDRIANVIRELAADVVGLQEIDTRAGRAGLDQVVHLARATGLAAIPGLVLLEPDGGYGNAILTRHPIVQVRHIDLCVPGCEPRGALDVELEIGSESVRVIATHLGLRTSERRRQIYHLLSAIGASMNRIVVVLGDFNHWLPVMGPLHMLHAQLGRPPSLRTFPSWRPVLSLDRIWVRPLSALAEMRVHATPVARVASDHLPVRASVRLP